MYWCSVTLSRRILDTPDKIKEVHQTQTEEVRNVPTWTSTRWTHRKGAGAKTKTPPKTVGELRQVLGFQGYYRKYLANISRRAKLLYGLLKKRERLQNGTEEANENISNQTLYRQFSGLLSIRKLDDNQLSEHVMAYLDFDRQSILHVDTSPRGFRSSVVSDGQWTTSCYGVRLKNSWHLHEKNITYIPGNCSSRHSNGPFLKNSEFTCIMFTRVWSVQQ